MNTYTVLTPVLNGDGSINYGQTTIHKVGPQLAPTQGDIPLAQMQAESAAAQTRINACDTAISQQLAKKAEEQAFKTANDLAITTLVNSILTP